MVQQKKSLFKKQILSIGVSALALTVMLPGSMHAQEVAALQPTSGWNLKSDKDPKSGYCALSRAFDEGVVLTLGRNQTEEYSLAIDFQKAKLDPDKAYPVTLQPGPSQIRAYEMMPASARAMVVRLGYDEGFFKALETSQVLKAEVNNVKYNFQISDINKGQAQLNECMAKIKGNAPVQTAQKFKAEKIEEAEKIEKPKEEIPVAATKIEKTETKVAAVKEEPKPVEIKKATAKPQEIISPQKAAVEVKSAEAKAPKEIKIERVAQKEMTTQPAPKAEPQQEVAAVKAEPKLQRPTTSARDSRLVSSSVKVPASTTNLKATSQSVPKTKPKAEKKIAAVKAPITAEMEAAPKPFSSSTPKVLMEVKEPKIKAVEVTREEKIVPKLIANQTEKVQAEKAQIQVDAGEINQKQKEIAQAVKTQEEKLQALDKSDGRNDAEIRNIREEIAILRIENKKLYEEAEKARGRLDSVAVESGNQAMRRIREYERKLEAAKADNLALSREMEEMQRLKEDGRLTQVTGDAVMTQTVERYNEAEREVKRLGLLLEQQRAAHRAEKTELEQMLFDPAVTNNAQRQKLAQLEEKLKRAQIELDKRVVVQPKEVVKPDPKIIMEKQKLAAEKARLEQELKATQAQLQQARQAAQQNPDPKTELEKQKLAGERAQLNQNQKLQADLAEVKNQLKQTQLALRDQANRKPAISKPDPVAQQNNIRIEQLTKQVELQNKQLETYQRQTELEKQQQAKRANQMIAKQAAATQPAARASMKPVSSSPMAIKIPNKTSYDVGSIRNLLQQGGVSPNAGVDQTGNNEYQWNVGEVRGIAKVAHTSQTPTMDSFVKGFIANMKQSCAGDFASLPSDAVNSYEIACIGGMTNTSSSVVFTQQGDHYVAISHITTPENMDMAMDARDRIADRL